MFRLAAAFLAVAIASPTFAAAQEGGYIPEDPLRSYAERTKLPDIAAINAKAADDDFKRAVGYYVGRHPGMTPRDWAILEQAKADKAAKEAVKIQTSAKPETADPAK